MKDVNTLVPGFAKALEQIPGTLEAYRQLSKTLEQGTLPARLRAQIGVVVAQEIRCDYCIWVQGRLAAQAGVNGEDVFLAQIGTARNRRESLVLRLSRRMVATGQFRDKVELDACEARVFSEIEIAEIVAQVAFAVLTCYVLQTIAPRRSVSTPQIRKA